VSNSVTPSAAPTVTVATISPNPTNTSPIAFTVTFDQPVTGFDITDITINGATADNLTGSGANYTFNATPVPDGTITIAVPAGAATNSPNNQSNTPSNTATVTYDTTGPTINVPAGGIQATTDPGQPGAIVTYTVTADDPAPPPVHNPTA
jgi:hypothetical protein